MSDSETDVPTQPQTAPPQSERLPDEAPAGLGSSDGERPNEMDDDPANPVSVEEPTD